MKTVDRLFSQMQVKNSLLCCGLDPDIKKMPVEIAEKKVSDEEKVFDFLTTAIDLTAKHVCSYKIQKAFFDKLSGGHDVLREVIAYIHKSCEDIPAIVDCKIGDIDNTMDAYIHNLFHLLQADGVVVNPYMGDDVMFPLMEMADKAIVVLVKTSNSSGGIVQDVAIEGGDPLWRYILDLVVNRWNRAENMIPVISSNADLNMTHVRSLIPDTMPILLAGIGAQGGSYLSLSQMINSKGIGVFVNSSRGILYPNSSQLWQVAIEEAAIELKNALNVQRGTV